MSRRLLFSSLRHLKSRKPRGAQLSRSLTQRPIEPVIVPGKVAETSRGVIARQGTDSPIACSSIPLHVLPLPSGNHQQGITTTAFVADPQGTLDVDILEIDVVKCVIVATRVES